MCSTNRVNGQPPCSDDRFEKKNKYGETCCYKKTKNNQAKKNNDSPEERINIENKESPLVNSSSKSIGSKSTSSNSTRSKSTSSKSTRSKSNSNTKESQNLTFDDDKLISTSHTDQQVNDIKNIIEKFQFFKNRIIQYEEEGKYEKGTFIKEDFFTKESAKYKLPLPETRLNHPEYFLNQYHDKSSFEEKDFFMFTQNQKFLRTFLTPKLENRGLLLFHEVGVGKTCSSIILAENFDGYMRHKVMVIGPASLESNYKTELFDSQKLNYDTKTYDSCSGSQFLQDFNWTTMSRCDVEKRANKLIDEKYEFFGFQKLMNMIDSINDVDTHENHERNKKMTNTEKIMAENDKLRQKFSNRVIIIDEVHHLRTVEDNDSERVKQLPIMLERICEVATNVRLILLSATPMFDKVSEISTLIALLSSVDKHYAPIPNAINFINGQLDERSETNLKLFAKNYVSYMSARDTVNFPIQYFVENKPTTFMHPKLDMFQKTDIPHLKSNDFKFYISHMEDYQKEMYLKETDYRSLLGLSNIAYPMKSKTTSSESKHRTGFTKNFKIDTTKNYLSVKYINKESILDQQHIGKYSAKIKSILESVKECDGQMIIYSNFLWSGIIPIAIALEHIGFTKHNSKNILDTAIRTGEHKHSYIILSGDQTLSKNNKNDLDSFNQGKAKVALINEVAAEGVTFKRVREIHVLEPWHNMNKMNQIIGRGVRFKSHVDLDPNLRNVGVYLHLGVCPETDIESIDYRKYRQSLDKHDKIVQVENILKQNSIDCQLNIKRNSSTGKTIRIIDSKNQNRNVIQKDEVYVCMPPNVTPPTSFKSVRKSMLLLDMIELVRLIQIYIEKKKLYTFTFDMLQNEFKNPLLKHALSYLVSESKTVTVNKIKGYFFLMNDMYIFQPEEIDDKKITMTERKSDKQKFFEHIIFNDSADDSIQKKKNITLEESINQLKNILLKCYNDSVIDTNILVDMYVDSLEQNEFLLLIDKFKDGNLKSNDPSKYALLKNSFMKGDYLLNHGSNSVYYYNHFEDKFISVNKNDSVSTTIEKTLRDSIKTKVLNKNDTNLIGFTDLNKLLIPVVKLTDNLPNSKGSICTQTSSFSIHLLKKWISSLKPFDKEISNKNGISKIELCKVYEYILRSNNNFYRYPHYRHSIHFQKKAKSKK